MDDLISRQAAIDAANCVKVMKGIRSGKGITAEAVDCAKRIIADNIRQLPPAQPRMGKWIYHIDDLFPAESTMECNQCHAEQPLTCDDEFCPHCGAKMEVTT